MLFLNLVSYLINLGWESIIHSSSSVTLALLQTKISPSTSTTNPEDQDSSGPTTESLLAQPEDSPTQETPMNWGLPDLSWPPTSPSSLDPLTPGSSTLTL